MSPTYPFYKCDHTADVFNGNDNRHKASKDGADLKLRVIGLVSLLLMLLARLLSPSSTGVGTHQQLGLPTCPFLLMTGFPCPLCGITTSLSLAVRGEWHSALETQPFGLLVFLGGTILVMMGFSPIRHRIDLKNLIHSRRGTIFVYTLTILFILSWCYKIASMKLNPSN